MTQKWGTELFRYETQTLIGKLVGAPPQGVPWGCRSPPLPFPPRDGEGEDKVDEALSRQSCITTQRNNHIEIFAAIRDNVDNNALCYNTALVCVSYYHTTVKLRSLSYQFIRNLIIMADFVTLSHDHQITSLSRELQHTHSCECCSVRHINRHRFKIRSRLRRRRLLEVHNYYIISILATAPRHVVTRAHRERVVTRMGANTTDKHNGRISCYTSTRSDETGSSPRRNVSFFHRANRATAG